MLARIGPHSSSVASSRGEETIPIGLTVQVLSAVAMLVSSLGPRLTCPRKRVYRKRRISRSLRGVYGG